MLSWRSDIFDSDRTSKRRSAIKYGPLLQVILHVMQICSLALIVILILTKPRVHKPLIKPIITIQYHVPPQYRQKQTSGGYKVLRKSEIKILKML